MVDAMDAMDTWRETGMGFPGMQVMRVVEFLVRGEVAQGGTMRLMKRYFGGK